MKKTKLRKLNNNGAVMIAVILVISIVGILAATLFTMTMVNSQMKVVDRKSKETFYSAETALDEMTAGIQGILANSTREAYGYLLVNYLSDDLTEEERNENFKKTVVNNFNAQLQEGLTPGAGHTEEEIISVVKAKLATFISTTADVDADIVIDSISGYEVASDYTYVIIKAIKVDCENGSYSNSIITDIKITIPDAAFSVDLPFTSDLPFESYGLIAKQSINIPANTSLDLVGNMYAGKKGINVAGTGKLNAKSSYIITMGDIDIQTKGSTDENYKTIYMERLYDTGSVNLWAENININSGGDYADTMAGKKSTDIQIKGGIVNLANDLELNSKRGKVIISGSYNGFGNQRNEEDSSAIMVNGREALLDMSDCQKLLIAGRAFIGRPDYNTSMSVTDTKFVQYPTGESVSVRGNQIAYLVPSSCISLKHNPLTSTELAEETITFDWTAIDVEGKFKLSEYLVSGNEYIKANYRLMSSGGTLSGSEMVTYYYLNIKVGWEDDFFKAYCDTFGTEKMASIFTLEGLKTAIRYDEDMNILNAGQIMTANAAVAGYAFDPEILNYAEDVVGNNASSEVNAVATGLESNYKFYKSILRSQNDTELTEVLPSNFINRDAVANMINFDMIEEAVSCMGTNEVMNIVDSTAGEHGVFVKIINNPTTPYVVTGTTNEGILIATGDVEIASGASFKGLIIAGGREDEPTGKIDIGYNCQVVASAETVKMILGDTEKFNVVYSDPSGEEVTRTVGDFFMDPRAGKVSYTPEEEEEETEVQDIAKLVTYQNWVKN